MTSSSGEKKYLGLSESQIEYFRSLEREGVEVEDLMADDLPMGGDPEPEQPDPSTAAGKAKKKSGLRQEEREELIADIVARLNTKPLKKKRTHSNVRAQTPALFTGKRGSFSFFCL
jgi:hypothetical protein